MNPSQPDKVIHISKDEAMSMHVDDMLKRQMSMRGDPGVTREHRRAWYYQHWFVFALLGMLGAFAAWAVLEPFFDDELYIQGPITAIFAREELPSPVAEVAREKSERVPESTGSITVKGEKILLLQVEGLTPTGEDSFTPGQLHHVEVFLPIDYPRRPPFCRMTTPVFHPNIDPQKICIGDHWSAGQSLAQMIVHIRNDLLSELQSQKPAQRPRGRLGRAKPGIASPATD